MIDSRDLLAQAAERASSDPFFLGYALRAYRQAQEMDVEELSGWLGCPPGDLPRLALCRCPAPDRFQDDLQRLSHRFGLRTDRLAALLRQVEFLEALRLQPQPTSTGLLLAARDSEE